MALAMTKGMPRAPRILQDEFPYHVSTRTAGRVFVFKKWTYKIIIKVLDEAQRRYNVKIHHFKMMHTHYHMCLTTTTTNISEFEWYVNNQIAKRLNRRMGRKGYLWGERFSSSIIENETYLAKCIRYLYINGVRAGICSRASEDDQMSTFEFYARGKKIDFIVSEDCVYLNLGDTAEERQRNFMAMVDEPMTESEVESVRSGIRKMFYGSADFMERMRSKYLEPRPQ